MARYGQAFKDRAVARMLPPEGASPEAVSQEIGVSVDTLERWRAESLSTQRALDHQTPIQALKSWRERLPELFRKRVHDPPGLDTYVWPSQLGSALARFYEGK